MPARRPKAPSEIMRARVRAEAARVLSAASRQAAAAQPKSRRARWAIAATAVAAAVIAPFVYRSMHATAPATMSAPDTFVPGVVPVNLNETVDTARATPENLAFL